MSLTFEGRYAPKRLQDLRGHEEAVKSLLEGAVGDSLPGGIILVGPPGSGKRTAARLLVAHVNCSAGPTKEPPADDKIVALILRGAVDADVLKIDASKMDAVTRVREAARQDQYPPLWMRKKIRIVTHSEQLGHEWPLKAIEEPKPWVLWIFCAKDEQSLPATATSRCWVIRMKPVPSASIAGLLREVADAERIKISDSSLQKLVELSRGSMPFALRFLEEIAAALDGRVGDDDVGELAKGLKTEYWEHTRGFIDAVLIGNFTDALVASSQQIGTGVDPDQFMLRVHRFCFYIVLIDVGQEVLTEYMKRNGHADGEVLDVIAVRAKLAGVAKDPTRVARAWMRLCLANAEYWQLWKTNGNFSQFLADVIFVEMYGILRAPAEKRTDGLAGMEGGGPRPDDRGEF